MVMAALLSIGGGLHPRGRATVLPAATLTPGSWIFMPGIDTLLARDVMKKAVRCTSPHQLLSLVERQLIETHISGMPVVENGKLVGIISRSDVTRAQVLTDELDGQVQDELRWDAQADGFQHTLSAKDFAGFSEKYKRMRVRDVMRSQVVTCAPDAPVTDVAAAMVRHHIHRMIVVEDEKPVGIISSIDLVELVSKSSG